MGAAIQSHQHAHKVKTWPPKPSHPRGCALCVSGVWLSVLAPKVPTHQAPHK